MAHFSPVCTQCLTFAMIFSVMSLNLRKYGRVPVHVRYLEIMLSKLVQAFVQNNFCVFVSSVLIMIAVWVSGFVLYHFFQIVMIIACVPEFYLMKFLSVVCVISSSFHRSARNCSNQENGVDICAAACCFTNALCKYFQISIEAMENMQLFNCVSCVKTIVMGTQVFLIYYQYELHAIYAIQHVLIPLVRV